MAVMKEERGTSVTIQRKQPIVRKKVLEDISEEKEHEEESKKQRPKK